MPNTPKRAPQVKRYLFDLLERVGWTVVQGGLAVISVESFDVDVAYVPLIAGALAVVKGLVAKKVGNSGSASTLPESLTTK